MAPLTFLTNRFMLLVMKRHLLSFLKMLWGYPPANEGGENEPSPVDDLAAVLGGLDDRLDAVEKMAEATRRKVYRDLAKEPDDVEVAAAPATRLPNPYLD